MDYGKANFYWKLFKHESDVAPKGVSLPVLRNGFDQKNVRSVSFVNGEQQLIIISSLSGLFGPLPGPTLETTSIGMDDPGPDPLSAEPQLGARCDSLPTLASPSAATLAVEITTPGADPTETGAYQRASPT